MSFLSRKINLLGYTVSLKGIRPLVKIIDKISLFNVPINKTELKAFIHLCRFLYESIYVFADLTALLTELLKKDTKFIFTEIEINAWNLLKLRL